MMLRKRSILAGIAGAALLVVGCGSGDSGTAATVSAAAPTSVVSAAPDLTGTDATGPDTGPDMTGTDMTGPETGAAMPGTDLTGGGSAGESEASSPADEPAAGPASGNGLCLDTSSPAVWSALAGVDSGIGDVGWVIREASTDPIDACPDLSYLVVDVAGATGSSPTQILFFHHGTYLGTGTARATAFTTVVGVTPDSVNAQYRWLVGDEPSSSPQGGPSTVTYTWNGSGVTADGQFPPYL